MLYAELRRVRARQVVTDVVALAAVLLSLLAGAAVHGVVAVAAAPGETIAEAGGAVGRVPGLGGVGAALADAGRAQQEAVLGLALWLGLGVAAIGVAVVLLAYLPGRLAWSREAAAAAGLRDRPADLELLAYRGLARRPLSAVRAAVPDAGAALARGDHLPLARLELEALGLRPPS